jgi:toxin ParE1/3/4
MSAYVFSEDADLDLDAIWEYIAQDNIDAADRWIVRLFETFEATARSPGIGHKREDFTDFSVLFFPVDAYLIVCRAISPTVEIVAVTQGARDIPSFLQRRLDR